MILLRFGLHERPAYTVIGLTWCASFFLVRIVPSPYVAYHLLYADYALFSRFQFWCVVLLTPLPFILNSYWFFLLIGGVLKFLEKRKAS